MTSRHEAPGVSCVFDDVDCGVMTVLNCRGLKIILFRVETKACRLTKLGEKAGCISDRCEVIRRRGLTFALPLV